MKKTIIALLGIVIIAVAVLYIPKIGMYRAISDNIERIEEGRTYGLAGDTSYEGDYEITRIGKLIIVKIDKAVSENRYKFLRWQIATYYTFNERVHDVYINQGGTVAVDCRTRSLY